MRFSRLVSFLLGIGLLGLPALVFSASSASAVAPHATQVTLSACAVYPDGNCYKPPVQVYKKTLRFSGVLQADIDGTPTAVGGVTVTLQRVAAGTTGWVVVARTTTDVSGAYLISLPASTNASYRVIYAGHPGTYNASSSASVAVKVGRSLGAHSSKLGHGKFRFYGKIAPSYKRRLVYLQKKVGSSWKTIGKQRTTKFSRWSFIVAAKPTKGKVVYRARTKGDIKYIANYVRFTITTF
jgi:hypothetical protein